MSKVIGLTYDLKGEWQATPFDPIDAAAELDSQETVDALKVALENGGHHVVLLGGARELTERLVQKAINVDLVFNIAEGFSGRNRESQVAAILELYGVPFVGSDALTLGISLDKHVAKQCFQADAVPTPRYWVVGEKTNIDELTGLTFPLFVKTVHEGSSKGITSRSRVETIDQLKEQTAYVHRNYHQAALVEEFIKGAEYTVGLIGNAPPEVMPIIQYAIQGSADLGDAFYSYQHVAESLVEHRCVTDLEMGVELSCTLRALAQRAFRAVGCRDFGRVDLRVDSQGRAFVLEINPLPDLTPKANGAFTLFAKALGISYDQIINRIVDVALSRFSSDGGSSHFF